MIPNTLITQLRRLRPHIGDEADLLLLAYQRAQPARKTYIELYIQDLLRRHTGASLLDERAPHLVPPPAGRVAGPLTIGQVVYHGNQVGSFGLSHADLLRHCSIFGLTGSGKTNTVMVLLRGLLRDRIPFLIYDWKRNYRDLLSITQEPLTVYTVGRDVQPLALNPLRVPPGCEPTLWVKRAVEIISLAYLGGAGADFLLMKAIDQAYRDWGVYERPGPSIDAFPTLADVIPYLERMSLKGRQAEWGRTVARILHGACFGAMGRVITADQDVPIADLVSRPTILELDGLSESDKVLIVWTLKSWIYEHFLRSPRREQLQYVIVDEEAHHLYKRGDKAGPDISETLLREIRELGVGVVLVDQQPSQLNPAAIANTHCSITLNLKQRSDCHVAADYCLLSDAERGIFGELEPGQAVVKLQSRYHRPFMIQIPHVQVRKGSVTDDDIRRAGPHAPAHQPSRILQKRSSGRPTPERANRGVFGEFAEHRAIPSPGRAFRRARKKEVKDSEKGVSADAYRLLADVGLHPIDVATERYARLGVNPRKGTQMRKDLEASGLLTIHRLVNSSGARVLMEPTAAGKMVLTALGIRYPVYSGSIRHYYGTQIIGRWCESKGMRVTYEHPVNGRVDIQAVDPNGQEYWIEFETGLSTQMRANVERCLGQSHAIVIFVAADKTAAMELKQILMKGEGYDHRAQYRILELGQMIGE